MSATYAELLARPLREAEIRREQEAETARYRRLAGTMPGCAPWCAYHAWDEDWSDDPGVCYSDPDGPHAPYGSRLRAVLSDEHGPHFRHLMHWSGGESATLEDAEAFARRILALVAQARTSGGAA